RVLFRSVARRLFSHVAGLAPLHRFALPALQILNDHRRWHFTVSFSDVLMPTAIGIQPPHPVDAQSRVASGRPPRHSLSPIVLLGGGGILSRTIGLRECRGGRPDATRLCASTGCGGWMPMAVGMSTSLKLTVKCRRL